MTAHQSVLLQESLHGLAIQPDGVYVDGTFGRGGHSRAILEQLNESGRLIAIDKDPEAITFANEHFSSDPRFSIYQGSFAEINQFASDAGVAGQVSGILLDLGVSSPQLDDAKRGFSFIQEGPLDMRMDNTQALSAERFVNSATIEEMAGIFKTYGEDRFAGRIARAIVKERELEPITTTNRLASIVKEANPKWEKHKHPATRVFQAIRIHVNQELNDLKDGLSRCIDVLNVNGRLVVISFHSLEDRIVKQFMRDKERGHQPPPGVPIRAVELKTNFKRVGKAIKPSEEEIKQNVRSRSAVLRIGEKIS
jgi:16S rRNA (cytosine1402-N4)-methyltransferase